MLLYENILFSSILFFFFQTLDLHRSQLTHIFPKLFQYLPNIEFIDLSQNLLITLNTDAFANNENLKELNLNNNPWNCDKNMHTTLKWFKSHKINVTINGCGECVTDAFNKNIP